MSGRQWSSGVGRKSRMSASTSGDTRNGVGQAQQQLQRALLEALRGQADDEGRRRMLAIALLAAYSLIQAMPSHCRRPFALVLVATIQMLSNTGASQAAETIQYTDDISTIPDTVNRRVQLLRFVTSLALLDMAATNATNVDSQRAALERLGRLAQAHMRVAGGAQPRIDGWTPTEKVDGDGLFDDVAVPAATVGSTAFLLEHMRRLPLAVAATADDDSGGDPLSDVQAVGDAVAARAEELGLHVSIAMAGVVQAEQHAVESAFPHAGTIIAADAWAARPGAALALRHLLLDAASLVLEHSLRADDSLCLVPCAVTPDLPDAPADLVVYLVCRGTLCPRTHNTKSLQDDQPAAGYSVPDLCEIRALAQNVYEGRAEVDVRTLTEGSQWLVVRLRLSGALDAQVTPPKAVADIGSPAALDATLVTPQLGEFREMLRGARVVVRTAGATPQIDSAGSHAALRTLPLAESAGHDLRAAEAFLSAAGCVVERLAVGSTARSPATPGLSRQLVAQRPPAFVMVDGGTDVLRAEFELLRGTLSFAAKADAAQRVRTHSAATLGIVALVPLRAVARMRACVRALAAEPHALPPPVVKIIALPLGERRLLAGLRAAWSLRRLERYHPTPSAPASAFYALPARPETTFVFSRAPPATPSPPRSAASDGLYDNLRTVSSSTSSSFSADSSGSVTGVPAWSTALPELSVAPRAWSNAIGTSSVTHIDIPRSSTEDAPLVPAHPAHTPPSPLIEVNSSLARTLRFAAAADEPRAVSPGTTSAPQTVRSVSAGVVDTDALPSNSAGHASVGTISSAPLEPPQSALDSLTESSDTKPADSGSPAATESPADQRSLSRTRTLLRDKMAMFNRARHRARNKLRHGADAESSSSATLLPPQRGDAEVEDELSEPSESPDAVPDTVSVTKGPVSQGESPTVVTLPEPGMADLDKPLPRLPAAAIMPAESPRSMTPVPVSGVATPAATTDKSQPSAQKLAGGAGRDRKARLRARLQDAGRRLAESQQQQQKRSKEQIAEGSKADVNNAETGIRAESMHSLSPARPQTGTGSGPEDNSSRTQQSRLQVEPLVAPEPALGGMSDSTPPIRVLLVEDNLINRSIMERFLRHMNVRYDVASNGEEAIRMWTAAAEELGTPGSSSSVAPAAVGRGPYHIVFMDIQMPIMDGIAATKQIRRLERQRHIGLWVPNGSMASMGAERLVSASNRNVFNGPGLHRASGVPREFGESSPRTVRWVPMHLRRLPPGARNVRYLHRHGLVQSVPTAPLGAVATGLVSDQDSVAAVRRNCSLSALRYSPVGISANIATVRRRAPGRSVSGSSRNLTVSTATTPSSLQQQQKTQQRQPTNESRPALHVEETAEDNGAASGPLLSPDDAEIDSVRHIAMFPPDGGVEASASVQPPSRGEPPSPTGNWRNARLARSLQLPPLQRQKQRGQTGERNYQLKSSSSGRIDSPLPVSVKSPVIIVALTASSLESDRRAALSAGCNDFLTKPVSLIWLKLKIIEWGCMQALIDHDGWRKWRSKRSRFEVSQ
ncbi:response regulator [Coemansia sp. RSA 1365]|nr:response regulator [Coemansia sp. RSA 1365]